MNDSLTFDPVPKQPELQALIPEGRIAVSARAYVPPNPAFGPGSRGYEARTRVRPRDQEEDGWRSSSELSVQEQTFGMENAQIDDGIGNKYPVDDDSSDDGSGIGGTTTAGRTYVGAGSYF